jgi:regulatory protein
MNDPREHEQEQEQEQESNAPAQRSGQISNLKPTRRDPQRIGVSLDGAYAFTLAADLVAQERLEIGDLLDEPRVEALLAADQIARATESALHFLAYRPRSEREVRDRLRRGGYEQGAIDQVVQKLHGWRYLDDADFARRWVEGRSAQKPRGARLLQQELRQKGIDAETAREVIAEADLDELAAAEALARKRLTAYAGQDVAVVRRRVGAFLARRGYGFDIVRAALDRALGEPEDDTEAPQDE